MPDKVIFTSPVTELPESQFYPQKLQKRRSHPQQLKLKDLSMKQQELQLWFCELALNGVNINYLNLQFPKRNPFADVKMPDDPEGRVFKQKFDAAKAGFVNYARESNFRNAQILMFVDGVLGNKLKEWDNYVYGYHEDKQNKIQVYNDLKNSNLWNIPLIQSNLKKIFEKPATGLPLFLEKLQSIGALNQQNLDKVLPFIKSSWDGKELSPTFNDQTIWQLLRNMPKEDAQRLFQKVMDSPDPENLLKMTINFLEMNQKNAVDCEKWVDVILKIKNIDNYLPVMDSKLIGDVKFWEFPDPESYLKIMRRVKAHNQYSYRSDEILPVWINQKDPALFPLYEKLSKSYDSHNRNLHELFNKQFLSATIPKDFELHMGKMKNPVDVILYLDFIRLLDPLKHAELCEQLDSVNALIEADTHYQLIKRYVNGLQKYPEVLSFLYHLDDANKYQNFLNNYEYYCSHYYPLLQENKEILASILPLIGINDFKQKVEELKNLNSQGLLLPELNDFFLQNRTQHQRINALFESSILKYWGVLSEELRANVLSEKSSSEAFKLLKQLATNQQITNIENCVRHLFDEKNIQILEIIQRLCSSDLSFLNQPNITPYLQCLQVIYKDSTYWRRESFQNLAQFITNQPVERISAYEHFLKTVGADEAIRLLIDNEMMEHPLGEYLLEHPTTQIDFYEAKKYIQFISRLYPEKDTQNIETLIQDMSRDNQYIKLQTCWGVFDNPVMLKLCYESDDPELLWNFYDKYDKNSEWKAFILQRPDCIPLINEILQQNHWRWDGNANLLSLVSTLEHYHLLTTGFLKTLKQSKYTSSLQTIGASPVWARIAALPAEEAQQIMSRIENSKSIIAVLLFLENAPADRNLVELTQKFSNEAMEKWRVIHQEYPRLLLEMNVIEHPQPEIALALLNLVVDWKGRNPYDDAPSILDSIKSKSFEELQGLQKLIQKSNFNEFNGHLSFYDAPIGQKMMMKMDEIQHPVQTRQYLEYIQTLEPERMDAVLEDVGHIAENAKKDESYIKYRALMGRLQNISHDLSQRNIKSLLTYPNPVATAEFLIISSQNTGKSIAELCSLMEQNREMSQWQDLLKSTIFRELINSHNVEKIFTSISPHTIELINQIDAHRGKNFFNLYFNPVVLDNLLKLQNHAELLEKLSENKKLYNVFYLSMSDKNADIKSWQAFIDANMPKGFLESCPPITIQTMGAHVGWYADVCQSSNPRLMLEFASFIPGHENRKEMIDKLQQHPNLSALKQFFELFKREPLILENHLMEILTDPNLNQMKNLIEQLMKRNLPLSFAYESARTLIQANGSVSIAAYYELYKRLGCSSEKNNGAFASGMVHLLQMDVADNLVPLLCQFWDSELRFHIENIAQLNRDADIVRFFPNISREQFRSLVNMPHMEQLFNVPHRESFANALSKLNLIDHRLKSTLSDEHLFERAEIIHRICRFARDNYGLTRFIFAMKNPRPLATYLMSLQDEQQEVFIKGLVQLNFCDRHNREEIMHYILSSPNPLLHITVMNQFLTLHARGWDEPHFRLFQQLMAKLKDENLETIATDFTLFSNKKAAFRGVCDLITAGFNLDGSLLRNIAQHEHASNLVHVLQNLHHFNLLSGEQGLKNLKYILEHDDIVDLEAQIDKMRQKGTITQKTIADLFFHNELLEPVNDKYIWIDPKYNHVHVLMPLSSGQQIGLDNTCMSAHSLQEFFGFTKGGMSIETSFKEYISSLKKDIACLRPESILCQQKIERLQQLEKYQSSLTAVKKLPDIQQLATSFPNFPDGMRAIMCRPEANLSSMQLAPMNLDGYLRTVNPVFSLRTITKSSLESFLQRVMFEENIPPVKSRETFIQYVVSKIDKSEITFSNLTDLLARETESLFGTPVRYNLERFAPALRQTLNQMQLPPYDSRESFIQRVVALAESEPDITYERLQDILTTQTALLFGEKVDYRGVTIQSIYDAIGDDTLDMTADVRIFIEGLLGLASPELFTMGSRDPFQQNFANDKEALNIAIQFYLAEINIYCHQQNIGYHNFGMNLQNDVLRTAFLDCVSGSTMDTIESRIMDFINQHVAEFGLSRRLENSDIQYIQNDFYTHFAMIKGSPHYDEFNILNLDKKGGFFTHQGQMAVHYLDYLKEAISGHELNQDPQMHEILVQSQQLPVVSMSTVQKIQDMQLEQMMQLVEQGYPLGFLLAKFDETKQQELLMGFGKLALYILEDSSKEMQNIKGNIVPKAFAYLQDLSIAYQKSDLFSLTPTQIECRDALEMMTRQFPEESNWLRALLIRDVTEIGSGLERFPNMPSKFIDAVFACPEFLGRINRILEERDAPPLKTPEDLAVYRNRSNATEELKAKLKTYIENNNPDDGPRPGPKLP